MNPVAKLIIDDIERFHNETNHSRNKLIESTISRYADKLKFFSSVPGQTVVIEGFNVSAGYLEVNSLTYYLLKWYLLVFQGKAEREELHALKDEGLEKFFLDGIETIDKKSVEMFNKIIITRAVNQVGGAEELQRRINLKEKCRLFFDKDLMNDWVMLEIGVSLALLWKFHEVTQDSLEKSASINILNNEILQPLINKYNIMHQGEVLSIKLV